MGIDRSPSGTNVANSSSRARALGVSAAVAATLGYAIDRDVSARRSRLARGSTMEMASLPVDRTGVVDGFDGTSLYYEEVGPSSAKVTVVFVHGYCVNQDFWYFQRQALTELFGARARFVFYDLRSHGKSQTVESDECSIDTLGQDLYAVVRDRAPKGKVVLIGHSMGGMAIMAFAQQHPEIFRGAQARVAGVGLISTSTGRMASVTFGLPALLAKMRAPILPRLLKTARKRAAFVEHGREWSGDVVWAMIRRFGFARPDVDPAVVEFVTHMIASTRIETIADFYSPLMDHDALEALPVLRDVPTTVICGDSDAMTPIEHSRDIAEQLPRATLVEVPQAGHALVLEAPAPVNDALAFLIGDALGKPPKHKHEEPASWRERRKARRRAKKIEKKQMKNELKNKPSQAPE